MIQPVSTLVMRMPSVQHLGGAGAGKHVERGLGHVGVRVAGALVAAAELALHRRHVHHVLAPRRRRGHRRAQPAHQDERRGDVAQLHFQQLQRVDLVHPLRSSCWPRSDRVPARRRRSRYPPRCGPARRSRRQRERQVGHCCAASAGAAGGTLPRAPAARPGRRGEGQPSTSGSGSRRAAARPRAAIELP